MCEHFQGSSQSMLFEYSKVHSVIVGGISQEQSN